MEGFCRGCLTKYDEPSELLQYCESNRRLFVYSTGLQVKRNDTFTFQLCKECHLNMKMSCKFKKQCRNSDKKFKSYLALKENGVGTDFSAYLKNADTLTFRLPVPISSTTNTPAHLKNDDDDNESTCTSIQNFMSDMLQGEEMPPTEARIIREVIQEEADILDESLDSHWLQDDASVDNDFGLDISFGSFSTPRSVNHNHTYTPRSITDEKEEIHFYTPKETRRQNVTDVQPNDMPILEDGGIQLLDIFNNDTVDEVDTKYDVLNVTDAGQSNIANKNDMPLLDSIELDDVGTTVISLSEIESLISAKNSKASSKPIVDKDKRNSEVSVNKYPNILALQDLFDNLPKLKDNLFSGSNDITLFVTSDKAASISREDNTQDSILVRTEDTEFSIIVKKGKANKKVADTNLARHLENNVNEVVTSSKIPNSTKIDTSKNKGINQSPFSQNFEQFLAKSKSLNRVIPESEIGNIEFNFVTQGVESVNESRDVVNLTVKEEDDVGNIESPIKLELEEYINRAELKKNILVLNVNQINDTIDKNLELALKNDVSQEFSLDQLLVSPQKSIQPGASTPTINKILFGSMTPKDKDLNIATKQHDKDQSSTSDIIRDFLENDNHNTPSNTSIHLEPPQCANIERNIKATSGVDKIDATDINTVFKRPHNKSRGFKDIKKLKALCKSNIESEASISSKNSNQDAIVIDDMNDERLEDNDERPEENDERPEDNDERPEDHEESVTNTVELESSPPIVIKEEAMDGMGENDDISVTNLLNYDGDIIDLDVSICSDFLKDKPAEKETIEADNTMDRPLSPLKDKYDLDELICKICDKKYASTKALKSHFQRIHKVKIPKKKPSYIYEKVCHFCGKIFRDQSNLNKHVQRHHDGPDSYTCSICTLTFTMKGGLVKHMRAHKGDAPEATNVSNNKKFVCAICGNVSTSASAFNIHAMRHAKEYRFMCSVPNCNRGFYRASDLEAHMNTHTKTFNFACEYCPKVYKRRCLLMGHMYRHLNITKFECTACNTSYITNHLLKQHFRSKKCAANRLKQSENASNVPKKEVKVKEVAGSINKIKKNVVYKGKKNVDEMLKAVASDSSENDDTRDKDDDTMDTTAETKDTTAENKDTTAENKDTTAENKDTTAAKI